MLICNFIIITLCNYFNFIYSCKKIYLLFFSKYFIFHIFLPLIPFLQKYQFVHNYEKKTIGFYIPEKEEEKEQNDNEETDKDDKKDNGEINEEKNDNKNNNLNEGNDDKTRLIIYIIVGIVVLIGLLIAAFCLGKSLYRQRKKKVNELEENFDYNSSNKNNEKDEEGAIN